MPFRHITLTQTRLGSMRQARSAARTAAALRGTCARLPLPPAGSQERSAGGARPAPGPPRLASLNTRPPPAWRGRRGRACAGGAPPPAAPGARAGARSCRGWREAAGPRWRVGALRCCCSRCEAVKRWDGSCKVGRAGRRPRSAPPAPPHPARPHSLPSAAPAPARRLPAQGDGDAARGHGRHAVHRGVSAVALEHAAGAWRWVGGARAEAEVTRGAGGCTALALPWCPPHHTTPSRRPLARTCGQRDADGRAAVPRHKLARPSGHQLLQGSRVGAGRRVSALGQQPASERHATGRQGGSRAAAAAAAAAQDGPRRQEQHQQASSTASTQRAPPGQT